MTGKVVNLTRARKARARDEKRQAADANAARHGRTKAEREAEARDAERAARHLDQHRREDEE
ncbi:DUF4169 family protein [Roseicyclus persicicus]|uniref:DUF4169 family protein n=1 Tax=Roseicyclus persicicus TaxID=2650661 RepID=A0A7X6H2E6_9RHOB|nr:DUF4169 family protein [Roseibacterium persicicum]NKX46114.1 DUF4169 family protein [Roseibacterium persicicum]